MTPPTEEIPYIIYWNPVGKQGIHEERDDDDDNDVDACVACNDLVTCDVEDKI